MQTNLMKTNNSILTVAIAALLMLTSQVYAQDRSDMSRGEYLLRDSLQSASGNTEQTQRAEDKDRMAGFKQDRRDTKAAAKDAKRVERDANEAARESKSAVRSERKAQKSRKNANKQAEKAKKAREKSDNN